MAGDARADISVSGLVRRGDTVFTDEQFIGQLMDLLEVPEAFITGPLLLNNGSAASPAYSFTLFPSYGMYAGGATDLRFSVAGSDTLRLFPNQVILSDTAALAWGSSGVGSSDLFLRRDAANVLAQRNGVNGQSFRVYGTYTDASNYERLLVNMVSGGSGRLGTEFAGTGIARNLQFFVGSTNSFFVAASTAHVLFNTDNTIDVGATGANRPRTLYVGTSLQVQSAAGANSIILGGSTTVAIGTDFAVRNGVAAIAIIGTAATSGGILALQPGTAAGTKAMLQFYNRNDGLNTGRINMDLTYDAATLTVSSTTFGTGTPITSFTWSLNHLFSADNTYDIGASGATRPRTGYFATSVISPIHDSGAASDISFRTNTGTQQFRVVHTASAVNFIQTSGTAAAAGTGPILSTTGSSDTNVGMRFASKGTGSFDFVTNGNVDLQFRVLANASAVNYIAVAGSATGVSTTIQATGSDADVGFAISSRGTGVIDFLTNASAQRQFRVAHTTTAVNYLQVSGSTTTNRPTILAQGSDADVGISISSKGTGSVVFLSDANTLVQFTVLRTAGATRFIQVTGSNGGDPTLSVSAGQLAITPNIVGAGNLHIQGFSGAGIGPASTTYMNCGVGTTAVSSLRVGHGAAPSAPVNGDMWTTTAGLFVRINGVTVGPLT